MDGGLRGAESEGGRGGQGATYAGISLVSSLGNKETEVVRRKEGEEGGGQPSPVDAGLPLLAAKWRVGVGGPASYPAQHAQIGRDRRQRAEGCPVPGWHVTSQSRH